MRAILWNADRIAQAASGAAMVHASNHVTRVICNEKTSVRLQFGTDGADGEDRRQSIALLLANALLASWHGAGSVVVRNGPLEALVSSPPTRELTRIEGLLTEGSGGVRASELVLMLLM